MYIYSGYGSLGQVISVSGDTPPKEQAQLLTQELLDARTTATLNQKRELTRILGIPVDSDKITISKAYYAAKSRCMAEEPAGRSMPHTPKICDNLIKEGRYKKRPIISVAQAKEILKATMPLDIETTNEQPKLSNKTLLMGIALLTIPIYLLVLIK